MDGNLLGGLLAALAVALFLEGLAMAAYRLNRGVSVFVVAFVQFLALGIAYYGSFFGISQFRRFLFAGVFLSLMPVSVLLAYLLEGIRTARMLILSLISGLAAFTLSWLLNLSIAPLFGATPLEVLTARQGWGAGAFGALAEAAGLLVVLPLFVWLGNRARMPLWVRFSAALLLIPMINVTFLLLGGLVIADFSQAVTLLRAGLAVRLTTTLALASGPLIFMRYFAGAPQVGSPAMGTLDAVRQLLETRESLQQVEARYRALLDAVPDAIFLCDEAGRIRQASAKVEQDLGYRPERLAGMPLWRVLALGPDEVKSGAALKSRLSQTRSGETVRFEIDLARADGSAMPTEVTLTRTSGGDVTYLAIAHDLTRQKRDQDRLQAQIIQADTLAEVSRIAASARDLESLLKASADRVADMVQADGCWITRWDESRDHVFIAAASGPAHERFVRAGPFTLADGPSITRAVLERTHPLIIEDYVKSPFYGPPLYRQPSVRSILALPLIADGAKLGAMLVGYDTMRPFATETVNALERAANVVALSITKMRLLEQTEERLQHVLVLNRFSERLAAVLDAKEMLRILSAEVAEALHAPACATLLHDASSDAMTLVSDSAGSQAWAGAEAVRWAEFFVDRMEPVVIQDAANDERLAPVRDMLTQKGVQCMMLVPLASGETFSAVMAFDASDRGPLSSSESDLVRSVTRYGAVALERADLFAEIAEQKEVAEALRRVAVALTGTLDYDEILDRILAGVAEAVPCDAANIQVIQGNEARIIRSLGYETVTPGVDPRSLALPLHCIASYRAMMETGQPDFVPDILQNPEWYQPEGAPRLWLRSWAGAPVTVRGEVIGFINVDSASVTYGQRDADLLALFANQAAIALENARLYAEAQEQRVLAETLRDAAIALSGTLDVEQILDRILELLERVVPYDAANIQLVRDGYAVVKRHRGYDKFDTVAAVQETQFSVDEVANLRRMWETQKPHHVADTRAEPTWVLVPALAWPRSWAGAPIVVRDEVIGFVNVDSATPNQYSEHEARLLALFANQSATALENALLYEQTERRLKELAAIYRVSQRFQRLHTRETLAEEINNVLGQILGYDYGDVVLREPGSDRLIHFAVGGRKLDPEQMKQDETRATELVPRVGMGIVGWVTQTGQSVRQGNVAQDEHYIAVNDGVRSELCVPLRVGDEVIGALNAESAEPNAYTDADQRVMETVAAQIAIAVQNVRLYEDLQNAYDQLKATQDEATRAERLQALGQMASGIAHDFNNVLTPILGYLELALDTPTLPDEIRSDIEKARRAALAASSIVARLREFYRPREAEETFAPVDLNRVVGEALDLTRPRWRDIPQQHGAVIQIHAQLGQIRPVRGDSSALRDLVTNLLLNAVDAMPDGGAITVSTRCEDDSAVLNISDTGVGMSEKVRRHVFEPFFSTKGRQGTGLGLSVCYGIVQRHGGTIDVESAPGKGTTFSVRLPLSAETAPLGDDADLPLLPPLRILLVDDEDAVLKVVSRMLERAGHSVTMAARGADGIARFDPEQVDVVITDLGMPEVTGRDVAAAVKQRSPETPVLLLTGWGAKVGVEESAPPEVDGVISKPVQSSELHRALAEILGLL